MENFQNSRYLWFSWLLHKSVISMLKEKFSVFTLTMSLPSFIWKWKVKIWQFFSLLFQEYCLVTAVKKREKLFFESFADLWSPLISSPRKNWFDFSQIWFCQKYAFMIARRRNNFLCLNKIVCPSGRTVVKL